MVEDDDDRGGGAVVPGGKGVGKGYEERGFVLDLDGVLVGFVVD